MTKCKTCGQEMSDAPKASLTAHILSHIASQERGIEVGDESARAAGVFDKPSYQSARRRRFASLCKWRSWLAVIDSQGGDNDDID